MNKVLKKHNYDIFKSGADTVKRGVSPITPTSSLSNNKLRESNSSFSANTSNNPCEDTKDLYMVDRGKHSNEISTKNVIFAASVDKSPSSFTLNEQTLTNLTHSNSITSTSSASQLNKQTLSPIVHHRNIQQNTSNLFNDSKGAINQLNMKPNSVSSSLSNYHHQILSNTFITSNNNPNNSKISLASVDSTSTPTEKTSSPSRMLSNHTNTLPSNLGRGNNIQYQFESNYLLKSNPKSVASPGNAIFFNVVTSISSTNASTSQTSTNATITSSNVPNSSYSGNNIYSTLPKLTNPIIKNVSNVTGNIYGNVSAVANEFEQLIARNTSSNNIGASNVSVNNHGSYNTLGSYRVQYSSTNPFLNNFNSNSSDLSSELVATDDK